MPKFIVDSLDEVSEGFRDEYEPHEGKFRLKVEGLEDPSSLRSALGRANNESAARRKELEKWSKLNKSPEEIETMLQELEEADRRKQEEKGNWDSVKNQMLEKHKKEIEDRDAALGRMKGTVERQLVDGEALRALAAHKGSSTLLLPHVRNYVKVMESESGFEIRVVDAKGEPRVNGSGEFLTVNDLVAEMKTSDEFKRAFDGTGQTGGGMPPGSSERRGSGSGSFTRSKMKSEEKAAYIREHGQEKYLQLPW